MLRLWRSAALRRARPPAACPLRSSEELFTELARASACASVETLDDPWPEGELRRAQPQAASRPKRPEGHRGRPTRDRAAPPEEPLPLRSTAPYPEGHDTAPGSTTWSLLGPFPKLFDPVTIRRSPRRLEIRGRSEDHLATSRACVRAPGPRRIYPRRPDVPKDDEAKEASASRPCGPSCSSACPKPDDPKGSPDELAPRISALGAHQHRPLTAQRTSEEARRAVRDQLRAPWERARSDRHHRSAPKSLPAARAFAPANPLQPADQPDATSRPRRDGRRPQRSRWPR